ncbi:MAG: hypothetical protein JNK87_15125 [Bryobacterales bacterium]|nr:hypothetical protein [Bryobacterales bacterium]
MTSKGTRILALLKPEGDQLGILTHHGAKFTVAGVATDAPEISAKDTPNFFKIATHHGARIELPSGARSLTISKDKDGNVILRFDE